ncbi:tetratricopeptide repeat protein [Mesonia ostreae]|uniref:Tetratricopeptide repeat protein n=1 Tax=Mesonia ostreae TaxID=861110 RepID=A0ABU2KLV0_9FLAO|nr:tetratricopeptide repeat protein [Mesonia ostreae]MDT0295698.1 tetratricopeptide repeat protein [Mesonia ostreae]
MGLTYLSLGLIQQGVGRHTQAIRYFEKRIEIYDKEPSSPI